MLASLPEFVKRTCSIDGKRATTASAKTASGSLIAPYDHPRSRTSLIVLATRSPRPSNPAE